MSHCHHGKTLLDPTHGSKQGHSEIEKNNNTSIFIWHGLNKETALQDLSYDQFISIYQNAKLQPKNTQNLSYLSSLPNANDIKNVKSIF